jgi:hypothetical protein
MVTEIFVTLILENPSPANLMQRMTDALSRMLNDPSTRNAVRTARAESQAAESQQEQAGEESGTEELRTEATGTQERSGKFLMKIYSLLSRGG